MTVQEPIAPSMEDLSRATVESSRFFGYTNLSGKIMALLSVATLTGGAIGVAQGLGYLGPVIGLTLPLGIGFLGLGAAIVTGLAGYWLGNFDDKRIGAYNREASRNFSSARGTVREKIERGFLKAIAKVDFDPAEKSLPYDALGHAVLLSDDKIASLPAHVSLDIYRTQLDLEVYMYSKVTSGNAVEGLQLGRAIMALPTVEEQTEAYKAARDKVRNAIKTGTLSVTPTGEQKEQTVAVDDGYTSSDVAEAVAEAVGDALSGMARAASRSSGSGGGFRGGGGSFGGGGATGSWVVVAPLPITSDSQLSSMSQSFSSSGGGGGGGFEMPDMDGDSAKGVLVVAGIVAAAAAAIVAGFSVWKNFISQAEKPALGDVQLPMITKSLASAEKQIRQMYKDR